MTKVWGLRHTAIDAAAMLVSSEEDVIARTFVTIGKPLQWHTRPRLTVFIEPRRKKAKPRLDISILPTGAFVLNAKAKETIGDFLARFGELLEVDCETSTEYFFNPLSLIDCIDLEKSK